MLDWLTRRRAPTEGAAPAPQALCAFCGKTQLEVRKIVAGPSAMICDECVVLCVAVMEESPNEGERFPVLLGAMGELLRSAAASDELASAAGTAAIHLAGGDAAALRRLVLMAFEGGRNELAVDASRAIDAESRTLDDDLDVAVALCRTGDFEDAAAALDGGAPATATQRARLEITRATVTLRRESNLDVVRLERMLDALERVASEMDASHAATASACRAECLFRLGEVGRARAVLEEAREREGLSTIGLMILGDVAMACGERSEAIDCYRRALEQGGPTRAEIEKRLARIGGDPYR